MVKIRHQSTATARVGRVVLAALLLCGPAGAEPASGAKAPDDSADPWDAADGFGNQPQPFAPTCFAELPSGSAGLSEHRAARWLEGVEGFPLELVESSKAHDRAVTLKGLARLKAPWFRDAVLRFSLQSQNQNQKPFKLHLLNAAQGVTLHYYGDGPWHGWVAYRTTRRPGESMMIGGEPHVVADGGLALLAGDDRRSGRTLSGTYEIRHQDAALVMTQGDVRLLTVPLAGPPTEVYLEGSSALLRELTMYRGEPVPEQPPAARQVVLGGQRPDRLRWRESLPPGAALKKLSDGRVELVINDTDSPAWASVPLIRAGLYEVIFEVEDPSPGTGVYLGDDEGRPMLRIGFFRDPRTGLTVFGHDDPETTMAATGLNVDDAAAPYAGRRQWLRLVLAGGVLKCFTSGDGVHWGQALPPLRDAVLPGRRGAYRHVGLYGWPTKELHRIKLRGLTVRRLDAVTSLASAELQEQAEVRGPPGHGIHAEETDWGAWRQQVWESLPEGIDQQRVDAAAWRRACAIVTLIRGAGYPLAGKLTNGLLQDGLASPGSVQSKLRLLQDAALLYDARTTDDALRFLSHYERLGRALLSQGDREGFDAVRRALMTVPLWTQNHRVEIALGSLARSELIARVYHEEWEDVRRLCRQLNFWNRAANLAAAWSSDPAGLRTLVEWAEARAWHEQPAQILENAIGKRTAPASLAAGGPMRPDWLHPLSVSLSKEAYNVQAELQAALAEKSYQSARQILTSTVAQPDALFRKWGLVTDTADERLFVSLPTAIGLIMREHPRLRQTIHDEFNDADRLRMNRALAEGDAATIRRTTVQYFGTPAAAEAYRWLGDQFMVDGQFGLAIGSYQRALPMAAPQQISLKHQLTARARLAAAMLGRSLVGNWPRPSGGPVEFHDTQLTAQQFEQLIAEMLEQHGGHTAESSPATAGNAAAAPAVAQFAARPWAELRGPHLRHDVGSRPEQVPAVAAAVDWPARQLAVAAAGERMIVANRFEVVGLDLATGKQKWAHSLGPISKDEAQGPTHAWPLVAMRPQVSGSRVYVRLLTKLFPKRPQIVCLDVQTGRRLWTSENHRPFASDPFFVDGHPLALSVDLSPERPVSQIMLASLDPESGVVLSEKPLLEFRGPFWKNPQHVCQATVADDKIVALVAGTLLCCDTLGQVHWVRRDTWFPAALDPAYGQRRHQPPLVAGDRVYATQPGVRSVECVDLQSGRLDWRRPMPGVRRLLDLKDGRLLIESDNGICAVSARTGRLLWHHRAEHLLEGYLPGGPDGLLYVRSEPAGGGLSYPTLVWLDVQTGRIRGRSPLWSLLGQQPAVGPLLAPVSGQYGDRLWCFTGVFDAQGKLQPQRNVLELTAVGPAVAGDPLGAVPWRPNVDASLLWAVERVLPGWMILSGEHDQKTGWHGELAGRHDVLVTKAAETPVRLVRRVKLPDGGNCRLVLEIGLWEATPSAIDVTTGFRSPTESPPTISAAGSTLEIRVAGLTLLQTVSRPTATAHQWQRLEVDLSAHAGREVSIAIVQRQAAAAPAYMYWKSLEVIY